jgi:predicted dithiol-disulfide oxidoreductase (DUF899 family)
MKTATKEKLGAPKIVDRSTFQTEVDALRLRLRQGSKVFETYWTTRRGVEAMDNSYRLLDLTVYGRQERWEDSPAGWPQLPEGEHPYRTDGRPIVQWPRIKAGYSDDLRTGRQ